MALLLMDGFDGGDMAVKWFGGANITSSTTTRFSSGRSANVTAGGSTMRRSFTAASQVFVGFATMTTYLDTGYKPYIDLMGDTAGTTHLRISYNQNTIIVYRGAGSTQIATYTMAMNTSVWYYIEVSATIADSGGTCVVKVNGSTVINFTGDTKNGGTNSTIDTIFFGFNSATGTSYFDDVYVCDATGSAPYNTFLGEVRMYVLTPSGAGSSTQFTPSSGANYTTVDEIPYSTTDYVSSGTSGQRDTYAMSDLPASASSVLAVQNNIIAKKTDAPAISLKPAVKSGGSVYYGTTTTLTGNDSAIMDLRTTDPATSTAWTISGVNSFEAGFEVA